MASRFLSFVSLKLVPEKTKSLAGHLSCGLKLFGNSLAMKGGIKGKYALSIGANLIPEKDLSRVPTDEELAQAWMVVARDPLAMQEVDRFLKRLRAKRWKKLREMNDSAIPAIVATAEMKEEASNSRLLEDIFTKLEPSEVVGSLPTVASSREAEDAFVAEALGEVQRMDETKELRDENTGVVLPSIYKHIRIIERCVKTRNNNHDVINRPFFDLLDEEAGWKEYMLSFAPHNEQIDCAFSVLFYLHVKDDIEIDAVEPTAAASAADVDLEADAALRESVNMIVAQLLERQSRLKPPHVPPRFGLGIACDGQHLVFTRMDFEDFKCPVFVSKPLPLKSTEGLRYFSRFLCATDKREEFGLSQHNPFDAPGVKYVRALGTGGFADIAVVRLLQEQEQQDKEEEKGRECACKLLIRGRSASVDNSSAAALLKLEARLLEKLAPVDGVPKLLRRDPGRLFLSPIGVPLMSHVQLTLKDDEQRKKFALQVLEELQTIVADVHARGVIHGDIRPENLIVVDDNDDNDKSKKKKKKICLIDWGCATDRSQQAQEHQPLGYAPFMSDELLQGEGLTPADDRKAVLFTYLAIADNPNSKAPWPHEHTETGVDVDIEQRTKWLRKHALAHPELDLSLLF